MRASGAIGKVDLANARAMSISPGMRVLVATASCSRVGAAGTSLVNDNDGAGALKAAPPLTIASKVVAIARDFIIMVLIADCTAYDIYDMWELYSASTIDCQEILPQDYVDRCPPPWFSIAALAFDDELAGGWPIIFFPPFLTERYLTNFEIEI